MQGNCLNFFTIIALLYKRVLPLIILVLSACKSNTFLDQEKTFMIGDTSKVTGVTFISNADTIVLKKHEDVWRVNGYPANIDYVNYFFKVLMQVQIHSKVSENQKSEIENEFYDNKVEVLINKKKKILNHFFVSQSSGFDSFCLLKPIKGESIYLLNIPGYSFSIYPLFKPSINKWREKTLIDYHAYEIQSVELVNNKERDQSFKIVNKKKRNYMLKRMPENIQIKKYSSEQVERYLSYFRNIQFDSEVTRYNGGFFDSLKKTIPDYNLIIELYDNTRFSINVYPIFKSVTTNVIGEEIDIDPDNCYAIVNNEKNVYHLKYADIDHVIKEISYFDVP